MIPLLSLLLLHPAQPAEPAIPAQAAKAAAQVREIIGHRGSCADCPENTLAGIRRAIEVGAHAAEVDIRTTRDGALVCLHDAKLERTTNGTGDVATLSLAEIRKLDAGSKFNPRFAGERVPTLAEVLALAKGKIRVMLDVKEPGEDYVRKIVAEVTQHGEPKQVILGVRSVAHAKLFRRLLPDARQIGLVPEVKDIEAFVEAGVPVIRLWPRWLTDETLVPRVRKLGVQLNMGTGNGTRAEVLPLLVHQPESLSSDDPKTLIRTLAEIAGPQK